MGEKGVGEKGGGTLLKCGVILKWSPGQPGPSTKMGVKRVRDNKPDKTST